jgi:transposase
MAKPLITDELWEEIKPLIPLQKKRRFRHPGRKHLDDRKVLSGILFVLSSGIPWEMLPVEMGCGSGVTCWRRLRDWQKAGVWQKLNGLLLNKLGSADKIDWSRVVIDSSSIRAVGGGKKNRPQSSGSQKTGKQAPSHRRRQRRALGIFSDRSQRPRHHTTAEPFGRYYPE